MVVWIDGYFWERLSCAAGYWRAWTGIDYFFDDFECHVGTLLFSLPEKTVFQNLAGYWLSQLNL
jgi:hypothetical protein